MNSPHRHMPRIPIRLIVALALLVFSSPDALRAAEGAPLPATSGDYGWLQQLRIRFHNDRLLDRARSAIQRGDDDAAREHLLAALENDPGSNRAKLYLIQVYERQEQWEQAIAVCDDLLARYPAYIDGYLTKAFLALHANATPLAIAALEEVLLRSEPRDPRHVKAKRNLAQLYFKTGAMARAEELAQDQIEDEDTYALRIFLAECALAQDRLAAALQHLDAALAFAETPEQRGAVYLKQGYLHVERGDFDRAHATLSRASVLVPDEVDRLQVARQLGETALQQKSYARAAEFFHAFLEQEFDEHVAASFLEALVQSDAFDHAVQEAQTFLDRPAASRAFRARMLRHLLYLHKRLKRPEATYAAAAALYELSPEDDVLLEMAYAAAQLDDPGPALEHYKAYLQRQFRIDVAMAYHYLLKTVDQPRESERILAQVLAADELPDRTRWDALYELAQLHRAAGRMDDYFASMQPLVRQSGNPRFTLEYADLLVAVGRHADAVATYERLLEDEQEDATRFALYRGIAAAYLGMGRPESSRRMLDNALAYGLPDMAWHLTMAQIDFQQGQFAACVQRLLDLDEDRDLTQLYIGFAFYRMNMPGLALHHLNLVAAPHDLPPDQRYHFFANRAYLTYDQGAYAQTLACVEQALSLRASPDVERVRIQAHVALAHYEQGRTLARSMVAAQGRELRDALPGIARRHPDSALKWALLDLLVESDLRRPALLVDLLRQAQDSPLKMELMIRLSHDALRDLAHTLELAGQCSLRLEQPADAIALLTDSIRIDPRRASAYFLRGLAYFNRGLYAQAEQDFAAYPRTADPVSRRFWAELGIVKGKRGKYAEGVAALQRALEIYPFDIDSMEEAAYQFMKWPRNAEAKALFARAIDTYGTILPYLEGGEQEAYARQRSALKREYTKLDRVLGAQLYFSRTDYDFPDDQAIRAVDGALPSQFGAELNFRPPVIGFRNERTLDVFGRLLANFEPRSWRIDPDAYQGGIGLRYKPYRGINAVAALERLFKIGDDAENNWLARLLVSHEWNEAPLRSRMRYIGGRVYGDVGYFLESKTRWYYYIDGRTGLRWPVAERLVLTLPQALGVVRHETDDESNLLSYTLTGVGLSGRWFEPERAYVTQRWSMELYAHYVWGWFWDDPVTLDDAAFDGVVFGLNFIK